MRIKILTAISLFIVSFAFASIPKPTGTVHEKIEIRIPKDTVDKFVDAILASDDMTVKMPVLEASFRDCPEWKNGMERLIKEEKWDWAKMYYIDFYTKKVSNLDYDFLLTKIDFLDDHKELWEGTEPIESLMKELSNKSVDTTPVSAPR